MGYSFSNDCPNVKSYLWLEVPSLCKRLLIILVLGGLASLSSILSVVVKVKVFENKQLFDKLKEVCFLISLSEYFSLGFVVSWCITSLFILVYNAC